ncbi:MAG TPA: SRPBCC family protein [Actinomycetota bacterium]|nr:SRPBCC family protein [Actinomycetota bacterium]
MGKITKTAGYRVPCDEMWRRIGDFRRMDWHPAVRRVETSDDGITRKLTTSDGTVLAESLIDSGSRHYTYRFEGGRLPVADAVSTLRVRAQNRGACVVEWEAQFTATGVADDEAHSFISRIFQTGLNAL